MIHDSKPPSPFPSWEAFNPREQRSSHGARGREEGGGLAQRAGLRAQHTRAPEKRLDGDAGKHSSLYLSRSQFPAQLPAT